MQPDTLVLAAAIRASIHCAMRMEVTQGGVPLKPIDFKTAFKEARRDIIMALKEIDAEENAQQRKQRS